MLKQIIDIFIVIHHCFVSFVTLPGEVTFSGKWINRLFVGFFSTEYFGTSLHIDV